MSEPTTNELGNSITPAPSDNTTLTAVLGELAAAGYAAQFDAEPGGTVRCVDCDATVPASDLVVEHGRRLEGASDPSDMLWVVAARCVACDARGTLVLTYGPEASATDADVVTALDV